MKKVQCRTILGIIVCLGMALGLSKPANAENRYVAIDKNFTFNTSRGDFTCAFGSRNWCETAVSANNQVWEIYGFSAQSNSSMISVTKDQSFLLSFTVFLDSQVQSAMELSCPVSNSQYVAIDACMMDTNYAYNETGDTAYNKLVTFALTGHFTQNLGWQPNLSLRLRSGSFDSAFYSVVGVTVPVMNIYEDRSVVAVQDVDIRVAQLQQRLYEMQGIMEDIRDSSSSAATNNKLDDIKDEIEEQNEREEEAIDNISDQSTSDIPNSTSQQTTSLIGTISGFFSALGNIQTGSCQLTLNFPEYAGGTQVVNPCSAKEDSDSSSVITIINFASSVVALLFFVPLSLVLLRLIFGEIRSWTNG